MKRSVHLFIGGMEVEFKTTPDILYNFKVDDLLSPAAVKNSYSKTVTIPGTNANNRIFDNRTRKQRTIYQDGNGFASGQRPDRIFDAV